MDGGFTFLAAVRVVLSIAMFCYVSYRDVKTREVSDLVWIVFGGLGLCLDAYEVYTGALGLVPLIAAIGFMGVFALLSGYLGLFGGADLLAFVVVGLLSPTAPAIGFQPLLFASLFFPLTVISNSVLIGASGTLVVLIYNLMKRGEGGLFDGYAATGGGARLLLMLTGMKKSLDSIRGPPYEYPLESIGEDGLVTLNLRPDLGDDADASKTFKKLRGMGRKSVWVSYSLPFLLMLGAGYLSTFTLGDFALWLVSHFIH